jgi:hypothetical protein
MLRYSFAFAIIILNWNQCKQTMQCLDSLRESIGSSIELFTIVVDNGSTDDSIEQIKATYPSVKLLEMGENLGYAAGNNVGIRYALEHGAEVICILNNDVVVTREFLLPLMNTLCSGSNSGVVTPLIANLNEPEQVWALGSTVDYRTGTVKRLYAGECVSEKRDLSPFVVDVASGAALLAEREVFETVGLLDEEFFLYYEEVDWCLRVRYAGYQIMAVPSSIVLHEVSASLGQHSPVIDYYMLRNHLRFVARHWSGLVLWRLRVCIIVKNLVTIAAYTIKPHGGARSPNRNARLLAIRDALLGRWGKMGPDVAAVCYPQKTG